MNFVTLAFETAQKNDNLCEIGLTFVKNSKVALSKSWLVKPPCFPNFDPSCVSVHGIIPEDVIHSPELPGVWGEVLLLVRGNLVLAHHAPFAMDILRQTLAHYNIEYPTLTYGCTLAIAQKVFPPPRYSYTKDSLEHLCNVHNIPLKQHRAMARSRATADFAVLMFDERNIGSEAAIQKKLDIILGQISASDDPKILPHQTNEEAKQVVPSTKKIPSPSKLSFLFTVVAFTFRFIVKTVRALFQFIHFSTRKAVEFEKEHQVFHKSVSKVKNTIAHSLSAAQSPGADEELPLRNWVSVDGKHSIEARLISVDENELRLQKIDGSTIDVPFKRLRQEDVDWAKNNMPR